MKKRTRIILLSSILPILAIAGVIYFCNRISNITQNSSMTPAKITSSSDALWTDHYTSLDGMLAAADLVIYGKVVNSNTEQRVDMIFTKQIVEVYSTYKGNVGKGSKIEILQTGGEMNNIKTPPIEEAPLLNKNGNYLFFLKYTVEGHYLILGGFQGVGKIENNKITFNKENKEISKQFNGSFKNIIDKIAEKGFTAKEEN